MEGTRTLGQADLHSRQSVNTRSESRNSLAIQWLGLCDVTTEGPGSTPGGKTKILQAVKQKNKNKKQKTQQQQKQNLIVPGWWVSLRSSSKVRNLVLWLTFGNLCQGMMRSLCWVRYDRDCLGDPGLTPKLGRSLGEGNGTYSSILAWRIPWT